MSEHTFTTVETVHTAKGPIAAAVVNCPKISTREAEIIQEELSAAGAKNGWRLCVDFSAVTFLTSVGLGMLVTVMKSAKANGGKMVVYALRPELKDLLKLTHLDKVIPIAPDRAKAMGSLS
ncbi:MAG: STAS domain-containing protein [Phycisphaeraceae bacterium]|nr:STAS domain-containing protein [Phycisphaeraceae bacterium]